MATPNAKSKTITQHSVASSNYRYVEEVMKDLKQLGEDVDDAYALLRQSKKVLQQATLFTIDQENIKDSPKIKPTNTIKLKPSELKSLQENYAVTRQLYDTLQTLDTMQSKMLASFPRDSKEARHASAEIERMRKSVMDKLNEAFTFLRDLANGNAPQEFNRFVAAICQVLERSVQYEASNSWVYMFEVEGELAFTNYIELNGLVSETGEEISKLFIAVSYTHSVEKGPQFYLATMTTFEPPSGDLLRKKVADIKSAIRGINTLLDLDGFANSVGALPLDLLLKPGAIPKSLFEYQTRIKTIEITPEGLVQFFLKPSVKDRKEVDDITRQLYLDMVGITKISKNNKLSLTPYKSETGWVIKFFIQRRDKETFVQPEDLEFLKARFKLSDDDLKKAAKILNTNRE